MPLAPFLIVSLVGRGARFFLLSGLVAWGGPRIENSLKRYIDAIGWGLVAAGVAGYIALRN